MENIKEVLKKLVRMGVSGISFRFSENSMVVSCHSVYDEERYSEDIPELLGLKFENKKNGFCLEYFNVNFLENKFFKWLSRSLDHLYIDLRSVSEDTHTFGLQGTKIEYRQKYYIPLFELLNNSHVKSMKYSVRDEETGFVELAYEGEINSKDLEGELKKFKNRFSADLHSFSAKEDKIYVTLCYKKGNSVISLDK